MRGTKYQTAEEILRHALDAVGKPLGTIDQTGRLRTGKGSIGTVVEESWFGYKPNSKSEPDFPEAGIELKVIPFVRKREGIRAKERLVCNIIDYMEEYKKTFLTSSFWHKCEKMLLMPYEHKYDVPKSEFEIKAALLFQFPEEDLIIIQQDWQKIIQKSVPARPTNSRKETPYIWQPVPREPHPRMFGRSRFPIFLPSSGPTP